MGGKRGCALCGEMIDTGPRGTRRYCARCRKELERQRSRECQARKKGENADWQLRPQRSGHEAAAAAIAAQAMREGLSYGKYVSREWANAHARLKKPAWAKEGADEK